MKNIVLISRDPLNFDSISDVAKRPLSDRDYLRLKRRPLFPRYSRAMRTIDLYAGVGSMSLGLWEVCRQKGLGFIPVAAVDIDSSALAVYERNFARANIIVGDITTLLDGKLGTDATKKESDFVRSLGRVDFLVSGSPCQGFSPLNVHTRGSDRRNALYLRAIRLVELSHPRHIILENVPDVVNGDLDIIGTSIEKLKKLNYSVDAGVIDLSEIGVPQIRKRHILIASLKSDVSVKSIIESSRVRAKRSVRWAISDLEVEKGDSIFRTASKLSPKNQIRVRYLHREGTYDLPFWMRPRCHRYPRHSYKSMYGRLNYDLPAQTITSGFVSPGQGRFVHPSCPRTLTPHEAARMQFFPDFFDFSMVTTRTSLATMIGNAAPMKLSFVIGANLLLFEE